MFEGGEKNLSQSGLLSYKIIKHKSRDSCDCATMRPAIMQLITFPAKYNELSAKQSRSGFDSDFPLGSMEPYVSSEFMNRVPALFGEDKTLTSHRKSLYRSITYWTAAYAISSRSRKHGASHMYINQRRSISLIFSAELLQYRPA